MHVCSFNNAASTPTTLTHEGPLDAAVVYFHAQTGPQWTVTIDGTPGHFTHIGETGADAPAPRFVPEA